LKYILLFVIGPHFFNLNFFFDMSTQEDGDGGFELVTSAS